MNTNNFLCSLFAPQKILPTISINVIFHKVFRYQTIKMYNYSSEIGVITLILFNLNKNLNKESQSRQDIHKTCPF